MSLPTPNLDDRTWKDIVEEAKKIIPGLCPPWTDFNPSDPGIAMVELMGWMTEMLLYRLNRVPDKNYIKFMELMGITLKPQEPARTWLVFDPVAGADPEALPLIPVNTRVAGVNSDGESLTFETMKPLNLNSSRLTEVYTQVKEQYSQRTDDLQSDDKASGGIDLFQGTQDIPHMFYLGDPGIAEVGFDFSLRLFLTLDRPAVGSSLGWSTWDGQQWQDIVPAMDETDGFLKDGQILFTHLPFVETTQVNGHDNYWLRLQLEGYRDGQLPSIKDIKKALELKKESGVMPETGFFSNADIPFLPVRFEGVFTPFGSDGQIDSMLYIGSEVFSRRGIKVNIDIRLADSYTPPSLDDLSELKVRWEYYAQSGEWEPLGTSTPQGTLDSHWGFIDRTEAFTHSGIVTFTNPGDTIPLTLNGEEKCWIRAVLKEGNYGLKKKNNPPVCQTILLNYKEKPTPFQEYIGYDDFNSRHLTPNVQARQVFEPFIPVPRHHPEFYLGFDSPFSNNLHTLYFRLLQEEAAGSKVTWEYHNHQGWKRLPLVADATLNFTQRGPVQFIGPADWTIHKKFGKWAFWLRVRWNKYNLDHPPKLQALNLNAVPAVHAVSHKNEILGSCNGQPFQRFPFARSPILPKPRILVRELVSSIPGEIQDFKEQVDLEIVEEQGSQPGQVILWVLWREQENFYRSTRDSRHYILDIFKAVITFGDGIRGKIPPIGTENIKCQVYYTGGGAKGNIGKNTLVSLEAAIPFIDKVSNPHAAAGGADMETLEEAKLRAPWEVKHRHRAVTAQDFERFAVDASGEVALAHCRAGDNGIVNVLIIPKGKEDDPRKLEASTELCDRVAQYLDQHRLLTTRIQVTGPKYTDITIRAKVVLLRSMLHKAQQVRGEIESCIRSFFHPLTGGMYRKGWPMGRTVHISEIYFLFENVNGVDTVDMLELNGKPMVGKVGVDASGFPYLSGIDITFTSS
ncbi:MAG: putative baseplate assembly protein [bacterium]|nr:putative baseplate assembly protein [bacterium]